MTPWAENFRHFRYFWRPHLFLPTQCSWFTPAIHMAFPLTFLDHNTEVYILFTKSARTGCERSIHNKMCVCACVFSVTDNEHFMYKYKPHYLFLSTHTHTHTYIYIHTTHTTHTHTHTYIYIYSNPQTDCFVVSLLFNVARHVGHFKLGSKPAQLYIMLYFMY